MGAPSIIFILGLHRTGTTVLYQLLAETKRFAVLTAEDVVGLSRAVPPRAEWNGCASREFADLQRSGHTNRGIDAIPLGPNTPEEYGFVLSNWRAGWSLRPANLPQFRALCAALQRRCPGRPLLLKNPWDFGNASWIQSQFPDAKFIFLHRHPRETLGSTLRMMLAYLNERSAYLSILSDPYRRFLDAGFPFRLAQWICSRRVRWIIRASLWHSGRKVARYLREKPRLPAGAGYDLRFEDLCVDPRASLTALLEFLHVTGDVTALAARVRPPPARLAPELAPFEPHLRRAFGAYADGLGYALMDPFIRDPLPS